MMRNFLVGLFLIVNSVSFGQKSEYYLVKHNGDTIFSNAEELRVWTGNVQYGKNSKGKLLWLKNNEIKMVKVGREVHWGLLNKKMKKSWLEEIVAFNSENFITIVRSGGNHYLTVYNRGFKRVEGIKVMLFMKNKYQEIAFKDVNRFIAPVFSDCPELIKLFEDNIREGNQINHNIQYYNCNNAPDLIEEAFVKQIMVK